MLGDMLSQAEMMALLSMMVLERWVGVNGGSRGSRCSSLAGRRTQGGEGQEDGMALGRSDGNLQGARCWPPFLKSPGPALQKKDSKVASSVTAVPNVPPTNHPHRGTNSATRGAKHTARGPGDAEGVHPVTQK